MWLIMYSGAVMAKNPATKERGCPDRRCTTVLNIGKARVIMTASVMSDDVMVPFPVIEVCNRSILLVT